MKDSKLSVTWKISLTYTGEVALVKRVHLLSKLKEKTTITVVRSEWAG